MVAGAQAADHVPARISAGRAVEIHPHEEEQHMSPITAEPVELDALTELFGSLEATEGEALEHLDDSDHTDTPQAIGTVVWTVRVRC